MCVAAQAYGQHIGLTSAGPLPALAGCYADPQGSDITMFSQHGGPSETVAKQFLHLSNRTALNAKEGPGEEEEEQRKILRLSQAALQMTERTFRKQEQL